MRIGIDLGGTKIEGIALGPAAEILSRRRIPTPRGSYEATLRAVADLVAACEEEAGIAKDAASARIGIGHPGAISPATGLIKNANSIWLNGRPLKEDLERILRRPLRLANDANCFALSEAVDGAAAGARVVFGVILGTGTGGGVVVDGRVLTGPNAIAGEWGHNPLPWPAGEERPGPACYCGRSGCIETFLSGPGMARDHMQSVAASLDPTRMPARGTTPPDAATPEAGALPADAPGGQPATMLDAAEISARAEDGEAAARATVGRYLERTARALASVINLVDPDVIVLGGGMSNLDRLYTEVPRLWGRWVFSDRVDTRLLKARHGDSSGVRGAAWLWPAE